MDAMKSAKYQHVFLGTTKQGKVAIFKTSGNDDTHIILRGGEKPNYDSSDIKECIAKLKNEKVNMNLMVDFSHGNSQKNHEKQKIVCKSVAEQILKGNKHITGVMIESHLEEGNQKMSENLEYGKSITDSCIGWEETKELIRKLAKSVEGRREIG